MPSIHALATELVGSLEPREIILRLVERALDVVPADRCTLTSVDQHVLRVEASYDAGRGRPAWVGHEYPLSAMADQPLLQEAVEQGRIALGGGFDTRASDPEVSPDLAGVRRTAVLPLALGDEVSAVLILSRREDRPYETDELEALQEIGVLAILALRNARLFEAVNEAQERGLNTLTLISEHLAASDELPSFFGKMSASVAELVHADKAAFWMLQDGELVAQPEAYGFSPEVIARMRVEVPDDEEGPLMRLIHGGEALAGEIGPDALAGPFGPVLRLMEIRDVVAVPWRTAEIPLGILVACNSAAGFGPQDDWVMRVAARASAVVWQGYDAERRLVALQERERQNIEEHATRIAELEQQKSQFLRLASHELRTPLTIVRGYLSMFEEGVFGALSEQAQKILPTVNSRLAQMNMLIDQMLNAARLEDSRLVLNMRLVRLDEQLGRVVASMEGLRQVGQRITIQNRAGAMEVSADPEKVETILANLLSNAIKYSPAGGDIRCVLGHDRRRAWVLVTDHGIGIEPADLPRLFQRYGRLEHPATASIEGTGLGLFLSRELARLQGGDIRVRSTPGKGSTFTLYLPLTPTSPA